MAGQAPDRVKLCSPCSNVYLQAMSGLCRFLVFILLLAQAALSYAAPAVKIMVDGLDDKLKENVLAYLTIEQERKSDDLTERRIRRYHGRAEREIRQALQPFGYYHPVIESDLSHQDKEWVASYQIDPGPPVTVTSLDIVVEGPGKDEAPLAKARKNLPLGMGDRLIHADYEKAKAQLRAASLDNGYRNAVYTASEVRVYQQSNQAEVILHLQTGDKFHFGPVSFNGSDLSEKLLRSFVPFKTGDVWSNRELLKLQRGLVDSNYFSAVNIVPLSVAEGSIEVPLDVTLIPRKNQKYSIGLGFSTDTGPQVTLDWIHRRINRRGHQLGAEASASQIRQDISTTYSIPLSKPRTDVFDITASLRREDTENVKSLIRELRGSHNIKRGKWRQVLSLGYKREDYDIGSSDDLASLLIPKASWTWVDANNRLVARKGFRFVLETSGAHKAVLSDTSYIQGIVRGKVIYPLGWKLRLVSRADLGASALSSIDKLPASNRFFAGGDNSVRGYDYKSLGPTNNRGEIIGGKHLAVGSLEFDYQFINKWYAAVFYDLGNAFNDLGINPKSGVGFGIRWASPIGMVRVDAASAISEDNDPWRLHITFGPDF